MDELNMTGDLLTATDTRRKAVDNHGIHAKRVLDCHARVAVFDCDGTLWSGDSG